MKNIKETDQHIVIEFTNDNGKKYEVGYPKSAGYTMESIKDEIANAEIQRDMVKPESSEFESIHWVQNEGSNTSRAAINISIVGGYVNMNNGGPYGYKVNFANSGGWGFTFKDQATDTYFCSTPRNGNHFINYNSSSPTMIGVKLI